LIATEQTDYADALKIAVLTRNALAVFFIATDYIYILAQAIGIIFTAMPIALHAYR
jgi:hypothetical protein